MEDFKVRTCKLCFTIINDEVIASHSKDDLDVDLLKVDFHDSKHVICNVCSAKLFAVQKFKTTCLYTENAVNNYVDNEAALSPLDIKEVYTKERRSKNVSDDVKICRLCLQSIKNVSELKAINSEEGDMIQKLVPEMNIFAIQEPVMCKDCQDSIGLHCNFLKKYWEVEQNVGNISNGQISKASSPEPSVDISVKVEGVDFEFEFVKTECVDINCEEIKTESDYEIISKEPPNGKNEETTQYYTSIDEHKTHMYQCEQYVHDTMFDVALNGDMIIQGNSSTQKNSSEVQIDKSRNCNLDMFKCETCSYKTNNKFNFKSHVLIHKDSSECETYKCETCSFETKHIRSLKRHMLRHKDPSVQIYKCEKCNYMGKVKNRLKRHMLKHNNPSRVQMYKCVTCTYKTLSRRNLDAHMLIHKEPSEVHMYKCKICDYETRYNSHLKRHMLVHKDSSYVCEVCNYETRVKWNLKNHMLIHKDRSEVEKYKCKVCSYETVRKGNLKAHMLVHKDPSEGQMYKCETCGFETKHRRSIRRHMSKCEDYVTEQESELRSDILIHKDSTLFV